MSILWITPGFAADEHDYNCIPPMQLLALELMRRGVDLHIVTLEYPFRSAPYRWHGATVYPCNGRNRRWMKPLILWRALRFCREVIMSQHKSPGIFAKRGEKSFQPTISIVEEPRGQIQKRFQPFSGVRPSLRKPLKRFHSLCFGAFPRLKSWVEKFRMTHIDKIDSTNPVTAIHSFWLGWASGLGEWLSRRYGVRHLTTLMGQDVLPQNRKFMPFLNAVRVARLAAVSDFQNEVFEKNTGLRAKYVIPWGVEQSEIPSALPAERPVDVIGVGSLVPVKNWEKWLHVVTLVSRSVPSLRAELIGDGADRPKLERLAQRLGIEKNVRFAGSLSRPEVLAKMRTAKVLLHTAHYESFGYVLAEAAMNTCRVVGTPVGAMRQFGTSAESETELSALLQNALRQNIQKQTFVPFTMQETAEAYIEIYKG